MKWFDFGAFDIPQWLRSGNYLDGYEVTFGTTRIVYIFDDFVVKLGGYSNEIENDVWEALKDTEYAVDLMPVLAFVDFDHDLDSSDYDYINSKSALFMRKATDTELTWYEVENCKRRLNAIGIEDGGSFNFGRYRNKVRMLDYACVSTNISDLSSPLYKKVYKWK